MKGRAHPEDFATAASQPGQTTEPSSAGETQELRALSVQEIELRLKGDAQATPPVEDDAHMSSAELVTPELDHALYEEYVRGFDDVPTLLDAVALPPRRVPPPDFRRGERPDQRKEQRLDAHAFRTAKTAEIEQSYREYEQPEAALAARKKPKRRKPSKSGKRKKR